MSNVLMLNLCYDVPVKLYSAHLLLMCTAVIAPDLKRLADFFLLNRPVSTAPRESLFRSRTLDRLGVTLRTVIFAWLVGSSLLQSYDRRKSFDLGPRGPLHGIWDAEEFAIDGKILPPLLTDQRRWRRVIVEDRDTKFCQVDVQTMTGSDDRRQAEVDRTKRVIRATKGPAESLDPLEFIYTLPEPKLLILEGVSSDTHGKKVKIRAKLRRFDEAQFPLLNRGFHWINEAPFNR